MRIGNYTTQIASDVIHDGLSVELIDQDGEIVAEVLRCDASETLSLEKFKANIPLEVEEQLVVYARERLGEFESGKPFSCCRATINGVVLQSGATAVDQRLVESGFVAISGVVDTCSISSGDGWIWRKRG